MASGGETREISRSVQCEMAGDGKTGEISRSVQIKMAGDGKTGEISRVYSDRCWLAMAKQGRSAGVYNVRWLAIAK